MCYIKNAEYKSNYIIRFTFDKTQVKEVDFEPFLLLMKDHPMIAPYLNLNKFRNFSWDASTIEWNDFEMCFSAESLLQDDWSAEGVVKSRIETFRNAFSKAIIDLEQYVTYFPTKHDKIGFTDWELDDLLVVFPKITKKKFYKAMGVYSAMEIDGEPVLYRHDVLLAIQCFLEKRKPRLEEWD